MGPTAAEIGNIVRAIVEEVHPRQVILFGSAARGEARGKSDIDLLVLARTERTAGRPPSASIEPCPGPGFRSTASWRPKAILPGTAAGSASFTGLRSRRGAFFMPPEPGTPADWLRHARSDL